MRKTNKQTKFTYNEAASESKRIFHPHGKQSRLVQEFTLQFQVISSLSHVAWTNKISNALFQAGSHQLSHEQCMTRVGGRNRNYLFWSIFGCGWLTKGE